MGLATGWRCELQRLILEDKSQAPRSEMASGLHPSSAVVRLPGETTVQTTPPCTREPHSHQWSLIILSRMRIPGALGV